MAGSKLTALADLAGGQVSTDLAYVVDLSAGVNGSKKSTLNDLFSIITKNVTDGALRFQTFAAPSLSAAAQGAAYFDSTINRLLLSENAGPFMPLQQNMYLDFDSATTVANTTTETSLLGAADDGSTLTITPPMARAGRTFKLDFSGVMQNTGTPVLTLRLKLGGTTIVTYQGTMATITGQVIWRLSIFATIAVAGAAGSIRIHPSMVEYSSAAGDGPTRWLGSNVLTTAIDFSINQAWSLTVQWGTAAAANTFTYTFGNIDIRR